jgi:uncharacterized protein (TIGR03083 family)
MSSESELIGMLESVWSSMSELGSGLTEDEWKMATHVAGWNVQDNLSQFIGMERCFMGQSDPLLESGRSDPVQDPGSASLLAVEARRTATGGDVLAEFQEVTGSRLAQLRSFDVKDFDGPSWVPVGQGTVRDAVLFQIFASWVHEQDMRRALHKPGDWDGPVADLAVQRLVRTLPYVVGKKAGAPDGASTLFDLQGPMGRSLRIVVEGGKARLDSDFPDDPIAAGHDSSVAITMDTETFTRLCTGRLDPQQALQDGNVSLNGDVELGQKIVAQMNTLS